MSVCGQSQSWGYFIEYYRQYLLGRKFCVRTDHQALIWLYSFKEPKGRIARWLEILSAFDFLVEYRAGVKHGNAVFTAQIFFVPFAVSKSVLLLSRLMDRLVKPCMELAMSIALL
jgi:hypothetical protein